jgi:hypothetical protein
MVCYGPFAVLRYRLAHATGMGFYDAGRTFLDSALRHERYALTDALHGRMSELLKQETLTRRQFRSGLIAAFQELRHVRYTWSRARCSRSTLSGALLTEQSHRLLQVLSAGSGCGPFSHCGSTAVPSRGQILQTPSSLRTRRRTSVWVGVLAHRYSAEVQRRCGSLARARDCHDDQGEDD